MLLNVKETNMSKNFLGLDTAKTQKLADSLNDLLSNYQIFYMNVRGYHWNIKGDNFFELHVKFEEQYNALLMKVDEIAERVLTLGHRPAHAYSTYMERSDIPERKDVSNGKDAVQNIAESFVKLIGKQRELLSLANDADDEGTASLMSDYIAEQEKTLWMYRSYLGQ
jgi:starvation-inducible DNA-binding protein